MPNLGHDPKNPTDLLERPIKPGDIVAWGTTYGRSAALAVCRIERIRFIKPRYGTHGENVECPQDEATDYQLVLRPIKSTGFITDTEPVHVPEGYTYVRPDGTSFTSHWRTVPLDKPKTKNVKLVKNVVLIGEPFDCD